MGLTVDYITINVNKVFLRRAILVAILIASNVGTYKVAYNKGMEDLYKYIMQKAASPSSSSAPSAPAFEPHIGSSI